MRSRSTRAGLRLSDYRRRVSDPVDTGYRDNAIMESLGMRGLQFHDNMIENQLAKHGLKLGDIRYILHTHLHIDHAGQDDKFR